MGTDVTIPTKYCALGTACSCLPHLQAFFHHPAACFLGQSYILSFIPPATGQVVNGELPAGSCAPCPPGAQLWGSRGGITRFLPTRGSPQHCGERGTGCGHSGMLSGRENTSPQQRDLTAGLEEFHQTRFYIMPLLS